MLGFFKHHKVWSFILALLTGVIGLLIGISVKNNNVEYVSPKIGDITESIYGLGKVKTDQIYEVKIAVIKTLEKLHVHEGDFVEKGQPMVEMEDNLIFKAPFSGTVTYIAFHEKQSIFPQQTVLRLEDLSKKYIEVSLEQQGALRVNKGQAVRILFESIRGEQLSGIVSSIFSRQEEFLAHIAVDGLGDNVLPGMTADIAIEVGTRSNAMLVPLSAVSNGRIKVLRNDRKKTLSITVGGVDGVWAEVTKGDLKKDDQIIIKKQ
jgi:macrolide-specific efflux system membrane fusion protein